MLKAIKIRLYLNDDQINYTNKLFGTSRFIYNKCLSYKINEYKSQMEVLKIQYEEILKLDPNNSIANYRIGQIYYYKADYTTALTYLQKVYDAYPFDYDNTLMFAWTKLKLKKNAEAKELFNIVLLNRPKDASALEGLKTIK